MLCCVDSGNGQVLSALLTLDPPACTAKANSAGSGMTDHPPTALGVTTTLAWWIPFASLDSCVGTCRYGTIQ